MRFLICSDPKIRSFWSAQWNREDAKAAENPQSNHRSFTAKTAKDAKNIAMIIA